MEFTTKLYVCLYKYVSGCKLCFCIKNISSNTAVWEPLWGKIWNNLKCLKDAQLVNVGFWEEQKSQIFLRHPESVSLLQISQNIDGFKQNDSHPLEIFLYFYYLPKLYTLERRDRGSSLSHYIKNIIKYCNMYRITWKPPPPPQPRHCLIYTCNVQFVHFVFNMYIPGEWCVCMY